ncbi:Carboxypeptidase G2 precursor [Botrimarina colliarenosi]|uniref:Carboxypeptidase G2 n=1 Tax=Botrimarina colliarenosi TaxID=2528001 RepID=A0A5C6AL45_9BACT|nr:M20/M25/M40 family metallo-hydrolase [Botrimarina colliarenosi]TWU00131.1 Carboxypeptidase G2 precursor [Botrimarina colliarenosi]
MSTPATSLAVSDEEALDLVCQLMAIRGRGGEERGVMDFVAAKLTEAGADPNPLRFDNANELSSLGGGVGNAVMQLDGDASLGPRRMLMAHTDTVPVCLGSKPTIEGNLVRSGDPATGLGADDRSGTAVLLTTAMALLRSGAPHPPITFLWTVQEEGGLNGVRHVDVGMLGEPELSFNFDGGDPAKLLVGATGGYRMWVNVHGCPSHAGIAPEKGVSAAAIAAFAVTDLVEKGWHGLVEKGDQRGTCNIGIVEAGVATNVVAEHARLHIEARSHDPAFRTQIVAAIEAAFLRALDKVVSSEGRRGTVSFDGGACYESFKLPEDNLSLVTLEGTLRSMGQEPRRAISNGGLDANWITSHGIPTITLGTGQHDIHTVDETLNIEEYQLSRQVAWRLATGT